MEPVFRKYFVSFAGVFGSVARGETRPDSDLDLFVEFSKTPSLVQLIRFEDELKQAVEREVDVVVKGSEKSFIKQAISKDLIPIYGPRPAV